MAQTEDCIIIDDEKSVIDVLKLYCENLGCFRNIITARDGAEASKKLANQKFALILLDVNMPRKSGLDIIKEIAGDGVNSMNSVVIVTGELDKTVLATSMKGGVKHFLVKPFDEDQFVTKTEQVLNSVAPGLL